VVAPGRLVTLLGGLGAGGDPDIITDDLGDHLSRLDRIALG
jgi:hypothetical protein